MGKNLLAFPCHSTHHVDVNYDISEYCRFLESIGKNFNKIRICLFWKDILRGYARIYSDFGFDCVTAGHMYDPLFLPRLKSIICTATISTSMACGTSVAYCVIMGKPHFVKDMQCNYNAASKEILLRDTQGEITFNAEPILQAAFGELRDDITDKQKELVDRYWGTSSFRTVEEIRTILSIAEDMYQKGPKFFLSSKKVLLDQAIDYANAGNDERALITLNQAVKAFPDFSQLHCARAEIFARTGRKNEALDIARKLHAANPSLHEASELIKKLEPELAGVCSPPDNNPNLMEQTKKYLNLGCGSHYHPDWTNVDIHSNNKDVIDCDLKKGIPFEDNSFDVVYHSHLLEHFPKSYAPLFLSECFRILKLGGMIRIAVPDLEQIARNYLIFLDKSLNGDEESWRKYEWTLLELFDQMVRNVSGGEMSKYWEQDPMPAESFVIERLGGEVINAISNIRTKPELKIQSPSRTDFNSHTPDAMSIGKFRLSGEVHQWMYDRCSLKKLLEEAGFSNIRVCKANESLIPEFNSYHLDILPDGSIRKPDSLFMEGMKKSGRITTSDKKAIKIVHLCMQDFGGAGNAAYRLHKGLRSIGIDSTMVVLNKRSGDPSVKVLPINYDKDIILNCTVVDSFVSPVWDKEWSKWIAGVSKYPKRPDGLEMFSAAESDVRLELVREILEADIINLHWTSGLMDIPCAPLAFRCKPVVWTLHDMNPFTGGCHYADTCEKYMSACGACPQLGSEDDNDVSHKAWDQKRTAYEKLNINVITPSKWLGKCASKSSLFSKFPVTVIPYGFPIDIYKPHPKKVIRKALNISEKAKVILFGADNISNKRKGFKYLLDALNNLEIKGEHDILLLTFGNVPRDIEAKSKYPMINMGSMNDQNQIAAVYSAADLFVIPSLEDNLPNTVVESMACGTPVLGFNIGGIPDMVEHKKTGYLVKPRDVKGIIEGITWFINASTETRLKLSNQCRKKAEELYALHIQANNYKIVYEELNSKEQSLLEEATKFNKKGEVLFSGGKLDEAMESFKKAIKVNSGFAMAYNNLGVVSLKNGTTKETLEYYNKALFYDPLNITFLKNLADYYYIVQKNTEKALQMYIKGLSINPEDIEILMALGNISIENGQLESAKDFFKKVIEIDPYNNDARKILDLLTNRNQIMTSEHTKIKTNQAVNPSEGYLVSAIVSAYNSERFIRGCIEDLEAQTIADRLEIVIVDSCSPQNERAIVDELQKKYSNIKYIRTEQRETVYAAWNRGIKASSGKYLTNANTDDRHRRDAFEIMVNELESKHAIALVYADVIMTEKENETFDRHTPCGYFEWLDWNRNMLLEKGCFMGPQPMWHRSVHDEYGYFDETMVTSGDYEFWLRISQTHNFYHINKPLGLYLKSPESIEHSNREKQHKENQRILSLYRDAAQKGRVIKYTPVKEIPILTQSALIEGMTSIIIVTHNRLDQTKKCIKNVRKHTPESYEIIFVDNGSTDGTVKWLQGQVRENKNNRMIENKENVGLTRGRNQGINLSQGEFILLLDNEVIAVDGWLNGMLKCLNCTSDTGIVGPMTNNGTGRQKVTDESCQSVNYLDKYAAKFKRQYHYRRIPCRNIAGFCMLFKRTLVEKIGLFDESFGTGHFEDEDFCWRSALADYQNYIAGDVFIHHQESQESPADRSIIDKKWTLSTATPEGKKLAVLKATELADDFYSKGKFDQAVETLINCIKLTPDAKEIYFELARIFIESKKYSEAWEVVGTMPEAAKNDLKGLEYAGYAKEGLGLDDEAAAYANRMLSLNGNHPSALNLKGVLAYKKGEKEKAANYFNKSTEADPGYGEAYANLGVLYWGMDQKDEALLNLRKGFVLSPTIPDVSSLYFSVVSSLGMYGDAEADFRNASKLYSNNKNIAFLYIEILIRQEKFSLAMIEIENALASFGLDEGILDAALAIRNKVGLLEIKEGAKKNTLSLCMIVKNEEKNIAKCLKSVRDIVDEMIVVDTGSTDKTIDIARIFGAKTFEFPWTGDFSAARNHSLAQATGDWILILDADEVISALDFKGLQNLLCRKPVTPAAYSIVTRNYVTNVNVMGWTPNSRQYPEEAGAGWAPSTKVRLFSRREDVFFSNPVHETLEDSLKNVKIPIFPCNIVVHHYGKLDMEQDTQKGEDYYLLGKIKYESDPTNVQYINELAKQAQVLNKYEEAIELWLKLVSLIKDNPQSSDYQTIARISYSGDPLSEIYTQLALAYLMLDRCEEARKAANKTIGARVKLKESVQIYANCEIITGSLDNALSALEGLLTTTPDYPPALFLMAVIFYLEEKTEKAQEILQELLLRGVQMTPSLNKIARQLHAQGKKDEALLILNMAAANKISNAETTKLFEEMALFNFPEIK